ncbi:MAG: hypothetical protein V5A50_12025, partial [Thiohalorhabdus sp.]
MPGPAAPPLGPDGNPLSPDALSAIFAAGIIEQETATERWLLIPEAVRKAYTLWRASPVYRTHRLERALGTPARSYYKYAGVSPARSHKPNSAVAQAYYNEQAGIRRLATDTGHKKGSSRISGKGGLNFEEE